jgi:hypothetical protein
MIAAPIESAISASDLGDPWPAARSVSGATTYAAKSATIMETPATIGTRLDKALLKSGRVRNAWAA